MSENKKGLSPIRIVLGILQGMLIGLGAVLPGISGGVLCVVGAAICRPYNLRYPLGF